MFFDTFMATLEESMDTFTIVKVIKTVAMRLGNGIVGALKVTLFVRNAFSILLKVSIKTVTVVKAIVALTVRLAKGVLGTSVVAVSAQSATRCVRFSKASRFFWLCQGDGCK